MAINDDATLVIGAGNYFTAPVDTEIPVDLTAPDAAWENAGHTSLEDIFSIASDGGEATVIGTLQNKSLRTSYSTRTETMTFTLQQFDLDSLRLYYGANASVGPNGEVRVPSNPKPTVAAFLVVFIDGDNVFAFHAPKAEIYRADDLSISDTESLAGLPIGVKPLVSGSNDYTYAVTPLGTVDGSALATGADAGSPGAFTPGGSDIPADLAELQASSIVANPATAWLTGEYVELGDASDAYWDGSAWVTGIAP
jgi:hypothetical protein